MSSAIISFSTVVRRALDRARHVSTGFDQLTRLPSAVRATAAIALAATVLVAPASAGAAAPMPEESDLAARVQVVVKSVHIWDDRDWGDGDLHLRYWLHCTEKAVSCFGLDSVNIDHYDKVLSASSGETRIIGAVLPGSTDRLSTKFSPSVEMGYSLYRGHVYGLGFEMREHDDLTENEDMGERRIVLTAENGWAIGSHSLRSFRNGVQGDFTIDFEVRAVPLPDLQALHQITVHDLTGGTKQRVCMVVHNGGAIPAGPFEVALRMDGRVPPDGRVAAPGLAPGSNHDACVETELPTSGQHTLAVVVDEPRAVAEFNETNNVYEQSYQATGAPAAQGPTSSSALPDLAVSAIKVNGQASDGKGDCKEGKNTVTVLVKNQGAAKAKDFVVRLVVEGGAEEQSVSGLDVGTEREVRFDDVRLEKGRRTLTATADAEDTIAEAKDDNNERRLTATCKGDD